MQVGHSTQYSLDLQNTYVIKSLYQYFSAKQIFSHTPCDL